MRRQARSIARVDVLGRVGEAEKADLLANAWAVVSAAHHEGWGMSVLEGAAVGTPTLVSPMVSKCGKLAIFGDGLIGVSAGSDSVFPSPGGATQSGPAGPDCGG